MVFLFSYKLALDSFLGIRESTKPQNEDLTEPQPYISQITSHVVLNHKQLSEKKEEQRDSKPLTKE